MDEITSALQQMYEQFPYPGRSAPAQRVGWDVNLLLSYGARAPNNKKLKVLDAGCGRGVGILGAAALQPDVTFVGVDINRVGLAEAKEQAKNRKLENVTFQEVDLTTLEGLEVPPGGFDAIFSSGVVHHMPDPVAGLSALASALAPHGMLQLMIYGKRGREPLYRMVRAMDNLLPREYPLAERLLVARQLAQSVTTDALTQGPFADIRSIGDTEFVDRYLNVHERSYTVPEAFDLVAESNLKFLRWSEPGDWDFAKIVSNPPLAELAARLPEQDRFAMVEELAFRPKLEMVLCAPGNGPRAPLSGQELAESSLLVNPEVSFITTTRSVPAGARVEDLKVRIRTNEPRGFESGLVSSALLFLKDQRGAFRGKELVSLLGKNGVSTSMAQQLLADLVGIDILYVPHA
jgi:SAM-dependent methyltransferase